MTTDLLSDKDKTILSAIVDYYINTGDPVGSQTLSRAYNLGWSSATVRNSMSRFMDMGLLTQPHVSAGRIPTARAIRLYIDTLMYLQNLSEDNKGFIIDRYRNVQGTVDDLLFETSSVLSEISEFAGLATLPDSKFMEINSAKLIKIDHRKILLIVIFKGGLTEKTVIVLKKDIPEDVLKTLSDYLHSLSEHLTLEDLKTTVLSELKHKKDEIYRQILNSVLNLSDHATTNPSHSELFIKGHRSLIDKLDFNNTNYVKELIRAFEEKKYLIEILSKVNDGDGIRVFIGSEHGIMNGFSLVARSYGEGRRLGTIGVFGLLRMDYSKIIPLVDYTAKMVSNIVSKGGYHD